MNDAATGFMAQIRHALKEIRGDIRVLSRRIDRLANEVKEMPARLERQFRIAAARDHVRMANELVGRLEAEG